MSEDRDYWEQQFKAAVPPQIRQIAEMDHRRRTREEQEKLKRRIEDMGVKLAARLGLRRG